MDTSRPLQSRGDSESIKDDNKSNEGPIPTLNDASSEYVRQNDGVTKIEALCKFEMTFQLT
jgi:hypothetical protein